MVLLLRLLVIVGVALALPSRNWKTEKRLPGSSKPFEDWTPEEWSRFIEELTRGRNHVYYPSAFDDLGSSLVKKEKKWSSDLHDKWHPSTRSPRSGAPSEKVLKFSLLMISHIQKFLTEEEMKEFYDLAVKGIDNAKKGKNFKSEYHTMVEISTRLIQNHLSQNEAIPVPEEYKQYSKAAIHGLEGEDIKRYFELLKKVEGL